MAKRQNDKSEETKAMAALGGVYQRQLKGEQAVKSLLEALKCSRDYKNRAMEAGICGQLAGACRNAGNWEKYAN